MFEYSKNEITLIDERLAPMLDWAEAGSIQAEQLALDATRLLACTQERLSDYEGQGFFKRCQYSFTGKNAAMERANVKDLVEMQKCSWRYINLLNERDLLMASSIITIRNNLMSLAIAEENTKKEICRMADRISARFGELEKRVTNIEVSTNIHNWLLTLDIYGYKETYSPNLRLLRLVKDFFDLKGDQWSFSDLRTLQQAVKNAGLAWNSSISLNAFIDDLVDEIECAGFDTYCDTFSIGSGLSCAESIPYKFAVDNVAVPSFAALCWIGDNFASKSDAIDCLSDHMSLSRNDALKMVLGRNIAKQGIDTGVSMPLKDLAIELLSCMRITRNLFDGHNPDAKDKCNKATVNLGDSQAQADLEYSTCLNLAKAGDTAAMLSLAEMLFYGTSGAEENATEAYNWLVKAAELGDLDAQIQLAEEFIYGYNLEEDIAEAKRWLLKAVDRSGKACYLMGLHGYGEIDYENLEADQIVEAIDEKQRWSFDWYERGADLGDVKATCELGECYLLGHGVGVSFAKAQELILQAAMMDIENRHGVADSILFAVSNELGGDDGSSFYMSDNDIDQSIPEKKYNNAAKRYLSKFIMNNEKYLLYDNTVFGSAKDGFAVGVNRLVGRYGSDDFDYEMRWEGFDSIQLYENGLIFANGEKIDVLGSRSKQLLLLANLLMILHKISVLE